MKRLDVLFFSILLLGALNWGIIGFFQLDLIAFFFGNYSWSSRCIYVLIGISGIYCISAYHRLFPPQENI